MPDANKTDLTRQITAAAAIWLNERGFKPIETEVSVADKWVADLASIGYLTRTEAQRLKLIHRKPAWKQRQGRAREEWEHEYLALPAPLTAVVEVKISLSDLGKDTKWIRAAPARLLYLAVPQTLIDRLVAEPNIDDRWGLLVLDAAGAV